jgi:capsular exopolysaccharide synthesis family protein
MARTEEKIAFTPPVEQDGTKKLLSEEAFHYYRGLVGQIEIGLPHQASRVLLFTSSADGEGTTEVTVGLGLTLAGIIGRRTAIIDCNVRNPDIHRRFGVKDVGLDEFSKGEIGLDDALRNTLVPNLHVMPLGEGLTTLASLDTGQFSRFLDTLRGRFEYVLLDSAAVGVNPETTIICSKVDAVVMVVKYGSTRREVVRRAKETIQRAGGNLLGIVLNKRKFPVPEFLYRRL